MSKHCSRPSCFNKIITETQFGWNALFHGLWLTFYQQKYCWLRWTRIILKYLSSTPSNFKGVIESDCSTDKPLKHQNHNEVNEAALLGRHLFAVGRCVSWLSEALRHACLHLARSADTGLLDLILSPGVSCSPPMKACLPRNCREVLRRLFYVPKFSRLSFLIVANLLRKR